MDLRSCAKSLIFAIYMRNLLILLHFYFCTKNDQSNKNARFLRLMAVFTVGNPQSYPQQLWIC
jgi:hypothetical protein